MVSGVSGTDLVNLLGNYYMFPELSRNLTYKDKKKLSDPD